MKINLPVEDVARILQAVVDTCKKDGWTPAVEAEMVLRKGMWGKKSTSFPTMVFCQLHDEGHLEQHIKGESTFYRVTASAVTDFALNVPGSDNGDKGETRAVGSSDDAFPAGDECLEKVLAAVLAVVACAGEDGWARERDVYVNLHGESGSSWSRLTSVGITGELAKYIQRGWLERTGSEGLFSYRVSDKARQQFGDEIDVASKPADDLPPPDKGSASDPPATAEPLVLLPSSPPPPSSPTPADASGDDADKGSQLAASASPVPMKRRSLHQRAVGLYDSQSGDTPADKPLLSYAEPSLAGLGITSVVYAQQKMTALRKAGYLDWHKKPVRRGSNRGPGQLKWAHNPHEWDHEYPTEEPVANPVGADAPVVPTPPIVVAEETEEVAVPTPATSAATTITDAGQEELTPGYFVDQVIALLRRVPGREQGTVCRLIRALCEGGP